MALSLTPLLGIPMIQAGDDLVPILQDGLARAGIQLENGDVIVLAQKIVSKAEGRLVNLATIEPSQRALEMARQASKDPRLMEVILRESSAVLRVRPGTIIVEHRLGFVCASAGVDHSNVESSQGNPEDWVLLLPLDPDASARVICDRLGAISAKQIGVLIIDSHGRPWRLGTVGISIGIAGMPGLVDLRGKPDLFGFHLQITQVGAADELAAAASLVMGQTSEGIPVVHVRGFPYPLREASLDELFRPKDQDLFR
ncbi:MAG: coenzyme F420-0:L-glutamate ligase [Anaerolineales bacterium]|jgi:coenzyme F420-0:L-glutamate ligase/coenzyme F420-1:gamma-L-glutamate ligase